MVDKWTATPPTVPGWYWAYDYRERIAVVVHAFYMGLNDKYLTLVCQWDNRDASEFSLWAGPLESPELPLIAQG